ncbi:extracellular solute-binding protein [Paenibacillus rhizovicinus]|uniref:Extracellular solute-binding protein n=1 Tax=Paenibacillus rhizovicinus TaxID=2704463 RepID=A0A6C0NZI7_9BACL|nr:extracellular solute-binding protein [Paenibacillus rhizovicinus]QHW31103.1 extracellular solute-binding protein [Paenibacillus rhizovicinus]
MGIITFFYLANDEEKEAPARFQRFLIATITRIMEGYGNFEGGTEMKADWRRPFVSVMLALLLTGATAACSQETEGPGGIAADGGGSNAEDAPGKLAMKDGKYKPEVTMTVVKSLDDSVKFKNGETIEDNVFTRWAKERLGINIRYLWTTPTTNDAYRTKLMLALTANEPLPDVLEVSGELAQDLIDSGKFRAVGELFDDYASDTYKKAMDEAPGAWLPYIRNGKPYGIPSIQYTMQHDDALWIRQDWLDKLHLRAPSTIDELERVMDAFVNEDPDGNGEKDTYGLALSLRSNYNAWIGAGPLFGAFGAIPQTWERDELGNIVYGSVRPEIKGALAKFKEWIGKGYFHQEVALHDEMKAAELFVSGKAGMAMGPTWLYDWPLQDVKKLSPNAVVKPYPLPTGPGGKLMQKSEGTHTMVTLISKNMKHPEIYFTMENYLYDQLNDPKEGDEFQYGFANGYDYAMIDGQPVYESDRIPGGYVDPLKYFPTMPPRIPSAFIPTLAELYNGKKPTTPFEKLLSHSSMNQMEAASIVVSQHEHTIDELFTGAPTPTMKDKWQNLAKMEQTAFTKIMYGDVPLSAFDDFVNNWYESGGAQITSEVRQWYKSVTETSSGDK